MNNLSFATGRLKNSFLKFAQFLRQGIHKLSLKLKHADALYWYYWKVPLLQFRGRIYFACTTCHDLFEGERNHAQSEVSQDNIHLGSQLSYIRCDKDFGRLHFMV